MSKTQLEVLISVGSVLLFIILIVAARQIIPSSAGYGYAVALLVFVVVMGIAGLRLAEMPEE